MGLSKATFIDEHKNAGIVNVSYKSDEDEFTKAETEAIEDNKKKEHENGGVKDEDIKTENGNVREEKREEEKEEDEEAVPDGGWGWVVTFGCIIIAVIFFRLYNQSFSVRFISVSLNNN